MQILFIASVFITLMFFLSGFNKITDFSQVTKGFCNKTSLPLSLCKLIIVCVILLEIIAPLTIAIYTGSPSLQTNKMFRNITKLSILSLIVFTILATLLYHFPPYGSNYYSVMSNLSTVGGLLLLKGALAPF